MPQPLGLTDAQFAAVCEAAAPLLPVDRDPFLRALAHRLSSEPQPLGDGSIGRANSRTAKDLLATTSECRQQRAAAAEGLTKEALMPTEVCSPISRKGSAVSSGQPLGPGARSNPSRGDAGPQSSPFIAKHSVPEPAHHIARHNEEPLPAATAKVVGPED
jgi:hypothetical protein